MAFSMNDFLDQMFGEWRAIAQETCDKLGQQTALFSSALSDAIDIAGLIHQHYSKEEQADSLVAFELIGLCKELSWMQFHFLVSNYPVVMDRLRFNWEQIFRAYYVDTYADHHRTARNLPGMTVDDKHQWLIEQEQANQLRWPQVIQPALVRFFGGGRPEDTIALFRPLWNRMHAFAHPSGELRELLIGETVLKVRDKFDESFARNTLADAQEVIGLIFLAVLHRFERIVPSLQADPDVFEHFPQLRAVLDEAGAAIPDGAS